MSNQYHFVKEYLLNVIFVFHTRGISIHMQVLRLQCYIFLQYFYTVSLKLALP